MRTLFVILVFVALPAPVGSQQATGTLQGELAAVIASHPEATVAVSAALGARITAAVHARLRP